MCLGFGVGGENGMFWPSEVMIAVDILVPLFSVIRKGCDIWEDAQFGSLRVLFSRVCKKNEAAIDAMRWSPRIGVLLPIWIWSCRR